MRPRRQTPSRPIPRRSLLALAGVPAAFAVVAVMLFMSGRPGAGAATPSPGRMAALPTPTLAHEATSTPEATSAPTALPAGTPMPLAGSYPLVTSCAPSAVPSAAAPKEVLARSGLFVLRVPVLEYHRVVPESQAGDSKSGLIVLPEHFKAQMDLFQQQGWHTITMARLAEDLASHIRPPDKTFAITFDDGWDDGYEYALPILQAHGFAGTFYVIAGRIDKPGFLTSAHLRALIDAGNEIGNHTFDHTSLSSVQGSRDVFEVATASARIAQVTGRWPETLAYPYGGVNARVVSIVATCKLLRLAVLDGPMKFTPATAQATATPGASGLAEVSDYETWANRFAIPRIRVTPGESAAGLLATVVKAQSATAPLLR